MQNFNPQGLPSQLASNAAGKGSVDPESGRIAVQVPAAILLLLCILWITFIIISLLAQLRVLSQLSGQLGRDAGPVAFQMGFNVVVAALGIIAQCIVFAGAYQMIWGRDRAMAYIGGTLAMIPMFGSPFIFFGIPFAMWALIAFSLRNHRLANPS
jgi:hypothetical protein